MTSETILTTLIDKAYFYYKKNFRKYCPSVARLLDRKKPVEFNGIEYHCWKEVVIHNLSNLIQEYFPDIEIEVELNNNDSCMTLNITPEEEQAINSKIYPMIKNWK